MKNIKVNRQKVISKDQKETKARPKILIKNQLSTHKKCQKIRLGSEIINLKAVSGDGRGRNLEGEKEIFARWRVLPRALKSPDTMEELAAVLGLSYQTLWVWSKDEKVLGLIKTNRIKYFSRFTSEVVNSLRERCLKYGRAQDIKLWLEYVEGWIPKQEQFQDQEINVIFKGINRPGVKPHATKED